MPKKCDSLRFRLRIDVLAKLKENGYSQLRLRDEGLMWPTEITRLKSGVLPSWALLEKVCNLTGLTLYDVVEDRKAARDPQAAGGEGGDKS